MRRSFSVSPIFLALMMAGGFLLGVTSVGSAAPPVHSGDAAGLSTAPFAGLRAPRLPAKPPGVDTPERARQTAGIQYRAVVILLQFSDMRADTLGHPPEAFDTLLFSQGTTATGSLRDYYNETSRGAFDIDGLVTRWYTAPRSYSDYTNSLGGFGSPPFNAQQMALDAINLADPDVDFAQFDNDGPDGIPDSGDDDGAIDALFIVHAGPGGEETGSDSDIWSHKWNLAIRNFTVDGVSAFVYSTEPERWQGTTSSTTAGSLMTIGVFCHEFGHVLGLPDLYDTSRLPGANEGIGEWDVMASGLYNHLPGQPLGTSPAHMSAWSKMTLGWVEPTWVLQDSAGVTIPPVETSGQVFRLWTNGVDAGEFFLLENRQPIGFDAALVRSSFELDSLPAHGLLIYHIDPGVIGNSDPRHKMVDVEEGGGIEHEGGFVGVQNLDLERGSIAPQTVCGAGTVNVRGNRGDRYDPWPGAGARVAFNANTCPNSNSYCGGISQVTVENIQEIGTNITANFFLTGTTVRRGGVLVDDSPFDGNGNNGNGLLEPGETIRIHFPLQNLDSTPTDELAAQVAVTDPYAGLLADSIFYGVIGGAATDTGTVIYAVINPAPDPRGVNFRYTVTGPAGLVLADSAQILVGQRSGICETFEGTERRWVGIPIGCGAVNEWHRESGINHTPGGAWAWRLGPQGLIGHYAPSQDTRLVSQPIRLAGPSDTLRFWHRYDSEFAFDGLTIEISTNSGATWSPLVPLGGYNTEGRFSGTQTTFTQVTVPLTGYSGVVEIAFRFRSEPPNEGLGWWIDDVVVTGDASCATTSIAVERFEGAASASEAAVRLDWAVAHGAGVIVGIDRAGPGPEDNRARIVTLPSFGDEGSYLDRAVTPGQRYRYWLTLSREGEPSSEAGPIDVVAPAGGTGAPRVLGISPIRPNPFASSAAMAVSLDRAGPFMVRVYGADGRLVRTLARGQGTPAEIPLRWDGRDDRGHPVGAGIYFFELRSGERRRVQRAVLLR